MRKIRTGRMEDEREERDDTGNAGYHERPQMRMTIRGHQTILHQVERTSLISLVPIPRPTRHAPQRNQNQQHSLLMHMPTKLKARPSTCRKCHQEALVRRESPEFHEEDGLDEQREEECVLWERGGEQGEVGVAYETAR